MFRHQQDFNIPFQRFIPMYHHHFGYQCRVQLYGCLRLIDLLEEIPHIVQINEDKNGERIIQLTDDAIRQAVLLNIIQLIRQHEGSIGFDQLKKLYAEMFRFELNYEEIGFDSIESMIESMQEKLTVNFYSSHLKIKSIFDYSSVFKPIKILLLFVFSKNIILKLSLLEMLFIFLWKHKVKQQFGYLNKKWLIDIDEN
jgi:hypothetical protein